jgi:CxxC motif-containing protein (DUF1111 family)
MRKKTAAGWFTALLATAMLGAQAAQAQSPAASAAVVDPGVRKASSDGGEPLYLQGLSDEELVFFRDGLARFKEVDGVTGALGGEGEGLGPRFNSNSCVSCHQQPYAGGSSPPQNPLFAVYNAAGASNRMPWFIAATGPVREARFVRSNNAPDGGVHDLFVITGRADAGACNLAQPSFLPAGNPLTGQGGNPNVVFRIPTPIMGGGLIEAIPDSAILANVIANSAAKQRAGIFGHPNAILGGNVNRSANDGTITRFGWKAQNKSLLMFSGEAYNVEMGISNELFPQERDEQANCQAGTPAPNDISTIPASDVPLSPLTSVLSDIEGFAIFMRMLAAPPPAPPTPSSQHGSAVFASIGCALCHVPAMTTGTGRVPGQSTASPALSNRQVPLYSDLLVHHMGTRLADGITQGGAGPDEFRTAPLWGLGQRVFFLHDGRTSNLIQAIQYHASQNSEANQVVQAYAGLSPQDQQDLINFLRSL